MACITPPKAQGLLQDCIESNKEDELRIGSDQVAVAPVLSNDPVYISGLFCTHGRLTYVKQIPTVGALPRDVSRAIVFELSVRNAFHDMFDQMTRHVVDKQVTRASRSKF